MTRITPFLWFDHAAEEAARFYASIFRNSTVGAIMRGPDGKALTVAFELDGQKFIGLNGGPQFPFTEAVSFSISCETQEDVDYYWSRLSEGGSEQMCAWLRDKYGLSWQVVPTALHRLLTDPDPARAGRAMQAMLTMKKIDIAALERAAAGE